MDQVMDITARAVSFIVLVQDTLSQPNLAVKATVNFVDSPYFFRAFHLSRKQILKSPFFKINAVEITWVSLKKPGSELFQDDYSFNRCVSLIEWLNKQQNRNILKRRFASCVSFPSPSEWRDAIWEILYEHAEERISLADSLHYLPLYVVLALGGNANSYSAHDQRLLQVWGSVKESVPFEHIMSNSDMKTFQQLVEKVPVFESQEVRLLITTDKFLIQRMEYRGIPLPFEYIMIKELEEISNTRALRHKELCSASISDPIENSVNNDIPISFESIFNIVYDERTGVPIIDTAGGTKGGNEVNHQLPPSNVEPYGPEIDPIKTGRSMELWGLALSGGGIRSATFNLGVLQGLAQKGVLSKIDYLSTVSGGGYIGGWFISWIQRNKSLKKIEQRLNPNGSSDPFAEEVRPIRWLRMYSNYLAPRTGIMSVDSWTMGMTLLRNMLVSQLVILSLMLTLAGVTIILYELWIQLVIDFKTSAIFSILLAGLLAGIGMHSYHKETFPIIPIGTRIKNLVTKLLLLLGLIFSFTGSSWLYNQICAGFINFDVGFLEHTSDFQYIFWAGFSSLVVIAIMGRYDRCIPERKQWRKALSIFLGVFFTGLAAFIGLTLFILACKVLQEIALWEITRYHHFGKRLAFTIGPPLLLEVLSCTVVLRMAFLGNYFPDERREWWGRIGAEVHRVAAIWIIFIGLSFFGALMVQSVGDNSSAIAAYFASGTWGAIVLGGIISAFSGKTTGEKPTHGFTNSSREILALVSPYVFAVGLIIYINQLLGLTEQYAFNLERKVLLTIFLALLTTFLSWRIGVNEFSMHLFYKQRLVRAFLGATRSRAAREKTANPYTGFDSADEILLKDFQSKNGYFGPYPLINATVNTSKSSSLDRQDRKAESFLFSPFYCGFDFSRTRSSIDSLEKNYDFAYRPTCKYAYKNGGPFLGTAMSISGAAASPNMGYHSSAATSFLLSVFNVRLGWWMGNPRTRSWQSSDPELGLNYIVSDLIGKSNTTNRYVCLSDGGHFDNMGLYELIRRRCKYIILSDGEGDSTFSFEGLSNAIRRCRIDFGVEIIFEDLNKLKPSPDQNYSTAHLAVGQIVYPGDNAFYGTLLYVKCSITNKESVDVKEYAEKNVGFPQQSTGDQFFDEAQFESYRKLGIQSI